MTAIPCPKCGTTMDFTDGESLYVCPFCSFQRYETLDEAQIRMRSKLDAMTHAPSLLRFTDRDSVSSRAIVHYENGQAQRARGDVDGAIRSFMLAVELESDFLDAHYWIAQLSDDPQVKREHLSVMLAHDPGNIVAVRELMVLDGKITRAQAELTEQDGDAAVQKVDIPVTTRTDVLTCPVCGGALTADETNGRVFCKFCGHSAPLPKREVAIDSLAMALIQRKLQPVEWVIGERIIHCNNCGAQRTIPARHLSMVCPFCGSNHVIETDALNSFDKPDGLIPFTITEMEAQTIIREKLKGLGERLVGLFEDNRIARATLIGIYLPFWVYDVIVEVMQTITDTKNSRNQRELRYRPVMQTNRISDAMLNVIVPAVKQPDPALIRRIADYEMSAMVGYTPDLLARYPAELYDVTFDKASLSAREIVAKHMRERYGRGSNSDYTVTVSTLSKSMTFMLLLMPVWIATLHERDGDTRTALINGQTGACALGKAGKR